MAGVTGSAPVAPALGPAVVTAADMVAGHVGLDISCLDRLYLNGYVAKLQTPGGVVYFFHDHRPDFRRSRAHDRGKVAVDLGEWQGGVTGACYYRLLRVAVSPRAG